MRERREERRKEGKIVMPGVRSNAAGNQSVTEETGKRDTQNER